MAKNIIIGWAFCCFRYSYNKNVTGNNLNLQSTEEISIVICDHKRDLLNCVDRAIILSNGKIIASGSPNGNKWQRCKNSIFLQFNIISSSMTNNIKITNKIKPFKKINVSSDKVFRLDVFCLHLKQLVKQKFIIY